MIQLSELRIGNLISYNGEEMRVYNLDTGGRSFYRINDISINKTTGCTTNGGEDAYNSIPLTEEWLTRFGFCRIINESQIDGIEMNLYLDSDEEYGTYFSSCGTLTGTLCVLCICRGNYFANNLLYVHQLQNLYHALTGQELEIKVTT